MKLLQKSELQKAKSVERKQTIDEGTKLAKRVDALRETQAQEEASLQKFRIKSIETINAEILAETTKRDALISEVKLLEQRKIEALKPLDNAWLEVRLEQKIFADKNEQLGLWEQKLEAKNVALNGRERDVLVQERRTNDMHKRTEGLLQEADTLKYNAERTKQHADSILNLAERRAATVTADALRIKTSVEELEQKLLKKQKEVDAQEIGFVARERAITDKYATLQRTISRLKK